jgi:aldehyde dehydrogenase (NAD+)
MTITEAPASTEPEVGVDIDAAIAGLRTTYESGRTTEIDWRRRQLQGVIDLVEKNEPALVAALASDLGRPAFDGWLADLLLVRDEAAYALKHLDAWTKRTKHKVPPMAMPAEAWTEPQPVGVVLLIAPWNYPIQLLLAPLVAAVAAGNAVLLKPSELAPATSAVLADLVPRYLDPKAITLVEGGVDVTTELLAHPWDHILFTGSTRVGKIVMEAAAKHLTPVTLELGGKSPTIVAADADLAVAARRIAWAKFLNAGQTCIAPDYLLVDRTVEKELTGLVTAELERLRDEAPSTSIVNQDHLDRLEGLLDGHGGEQLTPAKTDRTTRTLAPVVIRQPNVDAALMTEEIFGPILPILAVDSVAEAIAFVNARPRPLALYLFSASEDIHRQVLDGTTAGSVCINHLVYQITVPSMPFGGIGPSGMGGYHGKTGFDTFTHQKSVLRRPTKMDLKFQYPPYSAMVQKLLKTVTRWPNR